MKEELQAERNYREAKEQLWKRALELWGEDFLRWCKELEDREVRRA